MARWQITVSGKGIRKDTVDKIAQEIAKKYGEGATVHTVDATPPESRAERFSEACGKVDEAKAEFESLRDELDEWKGNLPENLQEGAKADELQEAIDALEELIDKAEEVSGGEVNFPAMM